MYPINLQWNPLTISSLRELTHFKVLNNWLNESIIHTWLINLSHSNSNACMFTLSYDRCHFSFDKQNCYEIFTIIWDKRHILIIMIMIIIHVKRVGCRIENAFANWDHISFVYHTKPHTIQLMWNMNVRTCSNVIKSTANFATKLNHLKHLLRIQITWMMIS